MRPLTHDALRFVCTPETLRFESTEELEDLDEVIGQERAFEALEFGVGIQRHGFNMFALGPVGLGKHYFVRRYLRDFAKRGPAPQDICYVHSFERAQQPKVLLLPAGRGYKFKKDMEHLIEDLRSAIRTAFESPDYRTERQALEDAFKDRQDDALKEVERRARKLDIAVLRTEDGIALAPVDEDGEVLEMEDFDKLPEEEQDVIDEHIDTLRKDLQLALRDAPRWEREQRSKIRALKRDVTAYAVGHLFDDLEEDYSDLPEVVEHLEAVLNDIIERAGDLREGAFDDEESEPGPMMLGGPQRRSLDLARYEINVLVDHRETEGLPVVYEDNPTVRNLIGQIDRTSEYGVISTNFRLIRGGALHRANGGFLILDAARLLRDGRAYDLLKRTLRSRELRIPQGEDPQTGTTPVGDASLEPETIPLNVKVVLVGERILHYLLTDADPDFPELFKVSVDFEDDIRRADVGLLTYARMLATLIRQDKLRHFHRDAVARVIEHSARQAGDSHRLITHMRSMIDLLREADYWAGKVDHPTVLAEDVQKAIVAQQRRDGRIRDRSLELYEEGTLLVQTDGEHIGQLNGLSVLHFGRVVFGQATRITARVWLGEGEVLDIEREIDLGGPIHSKGVLILRGFLGERYAGDQPLSLSASLVFEQSYDGVEGDSASLGETCALLSALSELPIDQSFAITGSMNQHGAVQPIGGVNEKIEGYFDLCRQRGLTGRQGVIIPASNVRNLMLRQDVVDAAAAGLFHVYPVCHVDEAAALLMHTEAGERDNRGSYPEGSINRKVADRLHRMAERTRDFEEEK